MRSANSIFQDMMVMFQASSQKMFMQNLLLSALKLPSDRECPRDTMLRQRFVLCRHSGPNTQTKIIDASVS
jgi:hypothetical protein